MISGNSAPAGNQKITLVRRGERRSVTHANAAKNSLYDSFGFARPDRIMDPFIVSVSHQYPPKPIMHHGQEFALTLEGKHEFYYDGQIFELEAGDAMYFDSDRPPHGQKPERKAGQGPGGVLQPGGAKLNFFMHLVYH